MERPMVKLRRPSGASLQRVDEEEWSEECLRDGLDSGGLVAWMYYGAWSIWRDGSGYSGELHQYRQLTDSFEVQPLEFALEKAIEWAKGCAK